MSGFRVLGVLGLGFRVLILETLSSSTNHGTLQPWSPTTGLNSRENRVPLRATVRA